MGGERSAIARNLSSNLRPIQRQSFSPNRCPAGRTQESGLAYAGTRSHWSSMSNPTRLMPRITPEQVRIPLVCCREVSCFLWALTFFTGLGTREAHGIATVFAVHLSSWNFLESPSRSLLRSVPSCFYVRAPLSGRHWDCFCGPRIATAELDQKRAWQLTCIILCKFVVPIGHCWGTQREAKALKWDLLWM